MARRHTVRSWSFALSAFLALATLGASSREAVALSLGEPNAVDEPIPEIDPGDQTAVATAHGGGHTLVVYRDLGTATLRGVILDDLGVPVNPFGFTLVDSFVAEARALYHAGHFVVLWNDSLGVRRQDVGLDGTLLDDATVAVPKPQDALSIPLVDAVAGNGDFFVAATYVGGFLPYPQVGWVVDDSGPAGNYLTFGTPLTVRAAFDGTDYAVVWPVLGQIEGEYVSSAQTTSPFPTVPTDGGNIAAASVEAGVFVSWAGTDGLQGAFVEGDVVSPTIIVDPNNAQNTAIAGSGPDAHVVWKNGLLAYAARVTEDGAEAPFDLDFPGAGLVYVTSGDRDDVVTSRLVTSSQDVVRREAFFASGTTSAETVLSLRANPQLKVSAAAVGDDHYLCWYDDRDTDRGLYCGFASAAPAVATFIATANSVDEILVASGGDDMVIVHNALINEVHWLRRALDGNPISSGSIGGHDGNTMAIAHDGERYLAVFSRIEGPPSQDQNRLFLQEIEGGGAPIQIAAAAQKLDGAAIAGSDGQALIVYSRRDLVDKEIYGIWVDGDDVSEPFVICDVAGNQTQPAVTHHDGSYYVVWEDARSGADIYFATVFPPPMPGALPGVGETFAIAEAAPSSDPRIVDVDDGHNLLVTWRSTSSGSTPRVFGTWLTYDGTIIDALPGQLTDHEPVLDYAVAPMGSGDVLLAYSQQTPELNAQRVYFRRVNGGSLDGSDCGDVLTETGEAVVCASRICEDGFCCQASCDLCADCGSDGQCAPVVNGPDDECSETLTCDENGECKSAAGLPCEDDDSCASGFCVGGLCCDQACDGACESCALVPGACITQGCAPYACGEQNVCLEACDDSTDCAAEYQCVGGECVVPQGIAPPSDSGCGCRVPGRRDDGHDAGWLLLASTLLLALRRRAGAM